MRRVPAISDTAFMTRRSLFVFIHVVSAMGVFGALAIEGALLLRLRRAADTADVLDTLSGFRLLRVLAPLSLGPTVMSGMYLVRTVWGWRAAWINVAFASLVLAVVAGVTTTALRVAHLRKAHADGESRGLQAGYTRDPILSMSFLDDHLPRGAGGVPRVRRADVAHFMLNEAEHPAFVTRVVCLLRPGAGATNPRDHNGRNDEN